MALTWTERLAGARSPLWLRHWIALLTGGDNEHGRYEPSDPDSPASSTLALFGNKKVTCIADVSMTHAMKKCAGVDVCSRAQNVYSGKFESME